MPLIIVNNLVRKHQTLIVAFLVLLILGVLTFRHFRYYWNPHYLENNAVEVTGKLYSPDSVTAVVFYTLDVGARGTREYQCLLKDGNYDGSLLKYNLPPALVVLNWGDSNTLKVRFDPNQEFIVGGFDTALDLTKDTIIVNGISIIIKQRIKENRDSVVYNNFEKNQ